MEPQVDTVVIGAGQAGLSVSHELEARGVEHVVLERSRVASAWRGRWDSFTLVTPNWTLDLPGAPYAGDEPEGFAPRDEIVAYLEAYAGGLAAEIREGVTVRSLGAGARGFRLETDQGPLDAARVVVTTGAFQRPHVPPIAGAFPADLRVIDATSYRGPDSVPEGRVLVVGSGQTGVQIVEDLHLAGREVVLSCGKAPWVPRRVEGTDTVTWLARTPFLDQPVGTLPSPLGRLAANFQATGRDGGHDLNFRVLQTMPGVTLAGRLTGVDGGRVRFADDLAESVAFGDARYGDVAALIRTTLGAEAPTMPTPEPFTASPPTDVDLASIAAVVFTSGFRADYTHWVHFDVFDGMGLPVVDEALRTAVPGLYFCGVHFLRTRRSALLFGVGGDAALLAGTIAADLADGPG